MSTITEKIKDPDAVLDYFFDWSEWLGADTISSATVLPVPAGIAVDSSAINASKDGVTVWVSGGAVATGYNITNRIVTNDGRTDDRTLRLVIKEK